MTGAGGLGRPSPFAGAGDEINTLSDDTRIYLTWPRALLVAVILMLLTGGRGAIFLVIVLGLSALFAARAVANAAAGLGLAYRMVDDHIFSGTQARLEVRIANRSRWPIPLLLVQARLPEGLHGRFRRVLTLGPGAERVYRFSATGIHRGAYRLGDTRVILSDWFGLFEESANVAARARLVVYPGLPVVPERPAVRLLPVGPRRDPPSPFRDDLPIGVRPYHRGDALRTIAWKQTAKQGELVVREFPPVRETATWLFLDLVSTDWDPLARHEMTERAISVAGTLCREEATARRAVGFATWGALAETGVHGSEITAKADWIRLPSRSDPGHPLRVLEVLAAIRPAEGSDFLERVRLDAEHLPWGARVLLLVPRDTPALWQLGASWAARGHPVTILVFERRLGRPAEFLGRRVPEVLVVRDDGRISLH